MLKNSNQYKDEKTHITYSDYKNKKVGNNKDINIFVSVFIISTLIILGFVKILSPNVDVGIADDSVFNQPDYNESAQSIIDVRLKNLKKEDEDKKYEDEIFSPEYDEKVKLPNKDKKIVSEEDSSTRIKIVEEKKEEPQLFKHIIEQPKPKEIEKPHPQAPAPVNVSVNAKVIVGHYSTMQQAEVAKSIMQESAGNINPIIKNMGNYYTLQMGAYSSKEKAQQAADALLKNNFPAKVIVE